MGSRLARIVKRRQDLPGQELFQYQLDTGEHVKVDWSDVNEYLREVRQESFTEKDFRTWHGTGHMVQQLAALGPANTWAIGRQPVESTERLRRTQRRQADKTTSFGIAVLRIVKSYVGAKPAKAS